MAAVSRPLVLIAGAGVAVLAALGLAAAITMRPSHPPPTPQLTQADGGDPNAAGRRLQLEPTAADPRADTGRPLRCFVDGQYVGMAVIADCAKRNGADPASLDVGLDPTGAMAAGSAVQLQPPPAALPPRAAVSAPPPALPPVRVAEDARPNGASTGGCLRYGGGVWHSAASDVPLNVCVRILFDGHCARPGDALYGRWAEQTVRLIPGRVEISADNREFHSLLQQDAGCTLPPG